MQKCIFIFVQANRLPGIFSPCTQTICQFAFVAQYQTNVSRFYFMNHTVTFGTYQSWMFHGALNTIDSVYCVGEAQSTLNIVKPTVFKRPVCLLCSFTISQESMWTDKAHNVDICCNSLYFFIVLECDLCAIYIFLSIPAGAFRLSSHLAGTQHSH